MEDIFDDLVFFPFFISCFFGNRIFIIIEIPIPIINPIPKLFFIISKSAMFLNLAIGDAIKWIKAPPRNHINVFVNPRM